MTVREKVFEVVRAMPGLTAREIATLVPDARYSAVTQVLCIYSAKGELLQEQKDNPAYSSSNRARKTISIYSVNPCPKPVARKMKLREPTAAGFHANMAALRDRVAELEQWKAAAIARFPDLGVDPVIIAARRLVAKQANMTDRHLADEVMAGRRDNVLAMQVAIEALSQIAA